MSGDTAIAMHFHGSLDAGGFPMHSAWNAASALTFNADWQGKNPDDLRETQVHLLWSRENLFLRYRCRFRNITVFPDADPCGRRDHLWDRDVAEVFLQPDPSQPRHYFEFEVSPNGFWIDLDIRPGEKLDPHSGMKCRVHCDHAQKIWIADLAIPLRALVSSFDPARPWRVNFFRVEGSVEPRFYSSWRPTYTPQPNFHVPAAFGKLIFAESAVRN